MFKIPSGLTGLFGWRVKSQDAPPNSSPTDSYLQKLVTYVPADIIAAYLTLSGVLSQSGTNIPHWLNWAVFGGLLAMTPFYVCYLKTVPPGLTSNKLFHWITSCVAFSAWVFALGGASPFSTLSWYQPVYGSIILVFVTLAIPILEGVFIKAPAGGGGASGGGNAGTGNSNINPPGSADKLPPGSNTPPTKK